MLLVLYTIKFCYLLAITLKGTKRNDIWQMDIFHFAEFGKLRYIHYTTDMYSGCKLATDLSSKKDCYYTLIENNGNYGNTYAN